MGVARGAVAYGVRPVAVVLLTLVPGSMPAAAARVDPALTLTTDVVCNLATGRFGVGWLVLQNTSAHGVVTRIRLTTGAQLSTVD